MIRALRFQITSILIFSVVGVCAGDSGAPPPLPKVAALLDRDVTIVMLGSSVTMNRPPEEVPDWTGGYDRLPPQMHGANVFFRVFEMLNDHENMCWRRLTDKDWQRQGAWQEERDLPYKGHCYGARVSYVGREASDWAELLVPAGYEKLDLIYTTDPKGDRIKVTIDGKPPVENALVDTLQQTAIPPGADLGSEMDTLDSHGQPRKLKRPSKGTTNLVEMRSRYRLDPAKKHTFRVQRGSADPDKRILVWGAVYWRGNCVQVIQRAKGGLNCGDVPNYHAIQETLAAKPDYVLMEAINIRDNPDQIKQTLEPGLAWCAAHAKQFKTMVYTTAQANSQAFRASFPGKVTDANAEACAKGVTEMCERLKLPMVDVGPAADGWLAQNPKARFIPTLYGDWYHPRYQGCVLFGQVIGEGIRKNWPELPLRFRGPVGR